MVKTFKVMPFKVPTFKATLCATALLASLSAAQADDKKYGPGVTDTEIKIGQTMPFSGPASLFGGYGVVMAAYFKMINEAGGINGRKINLIQLDNAFSPPKALEQTRKLVEGDEVLAEVGTVGTPPNVATQKYLNQAKVPQVFISAGGRRFNDPKNYPWSVATYPGFEMEGRTFGQHIVKANPNAKVAVIYQNDDYGKDYLAGLKSGLEGSSAKIVAEAPYDISVPTVDSQIVNLKDSGADTLVQFTTPKFAAQTLRKVFESKWTVQQYLAAPVNSIETVLKPTGLELAQGAITSLYMKQVGDPIWADDAEVKEYAEFVKKWAPSINPGDSIALTGYVNAQLIVDGLRRAGNNLTRENLLAVATGFKNQRFKMLLPGIMLSNSPEDYTVYKSLRLAKFEGTSWKLLDDGTSGSASK